MIGISVVHLVWLALLGGWIATDGTTFGQFMVSRPLVAASLAGWVVGDPVAGLTVGAFLEAFHLTVLPIGAARNPEGGPAAVAAGAAYALNPFGPASLVLALAFALVWEWVCGHSVHQIRQFNVRIVAVKFDSPRDLERRHITATLVDFLRGTGLVLVGTVLASTIITLALPLWGLDERVTELLLGAILVGMIASAFRFLGGRIPWFAAGLAIGIVLLILRP